MNSQILKLTENTIQRLSPDDISLILQEYGNKEFIQEYQSMQVKLQQYTNQYSNQEKILNDERVNKTLLIKELIEKNTLIERTKEIEVRVREEKNYYFNRVTQLESILKESADRINLQDTLIVNLTNNTPMNPSDEFQQSDFTVGYINANLDKLKIDNEKLRIDHYTHLRRIEEHEKLIDKYEQEI